LALWIVDGGSVETDPAAKGATRRHSLSGGPILEGRSGG
jgi:hypothetical protein